MNIKPPLKPHKHYIFAALSVPFSGGKNICFNDLIRQGNIKLYKKL